MESKLIEIEEKPTSQLMEESLPKGLSYEAYRTLVDRLAEENGTTGTDSPANRNYTLLNARRMRRWDKKFTVPEAYTGLIRAYPREILWLVLTESWCGDAAPTLPVMQKIAEISPNIELRVLLRDENPELMSRFLTDQAMSIPKLIMADKHTLEIMGSWGPRPTKAAKMATDFKNEHGSLSNEFREDLQKWYNKDKGDNTLKDLLKLLALE